MIVPFSSMPLKLVKKSVKKEREKTQVGSVQMASWFVGHVECRSQGGGGFKESNPFHDQDEVALEVRTMSTSSSFGCLSFEEHKVTVEKAAGSDMPDIDMKKLVAKSFLL
ncbi:autophagy-related protein 8C-like [Pyrus ussuriensis x Pyrus communis]|uniref:Autophagy-related protein 8C-like n=1 Tax=Pyrus ussuriensis x Pyrus communis TaxID=2448454 RepID=A0A5N5H8V8_9ROSA|nr:autophagy-related protein 8C-like [Pyrus ussuriensis x Pyrus communis]